MIENDFKIMINNDILKCEKALKDELDCNELFLELYGKYSNTSKNFPNVVDNYLAALAHPSINKENVTKIYGFLTAFKTNNYEDYLLEPDDFINQGDKGITVNNNIYNNTVITISDTKKEIENMSGLTEEDIEEINRKIDELEQIINSKDRKSKKWSCAKEIVKWMADKSVDVALTLIPLLLQIK